MFKEKEQSTDNCDSMVQQVEYLLMNALKC